MSLREKENKLFEEWAKGRKNFAKDGAGKNFESQEVKLIFVGKETNETDDKFDWREYLDDGVVYKGDKKKNKPFENSYNLYRWAKFLVDGKLDKKEYKKIEKDKSKRADIFRKVAFINIKKESGKSQSNVDEIIKTGLNNEEFLKKQLDLYLNNDDIKILFLLGDGIYTPIKQAIKDKEKKDKFALNKTRFVELYDNNLFVVKFYHFNPRSCGIDKGFELINKLSDYINSKLS